MEDRQVKSGELGSVDEMPKPLSPGSSDMCIKEEVVGPTDIHVQTCYLTMKEDYLTETPQVQQLNLEGSLKRENPDCIVGAKQKWDHTTNTPLKEPFPVALFQSVDPVTESVEKQVPAAVKPQRKKPLPGHCLTNVEPNRKQKLLFQSKRQAKSRDMKAAFFKGYKLAHEQTIEPIEFLFVIKDKKTDKYKYAGNGEMKERFENGLAITSTVRQDKKLYTKDACMRTTDPDNLTRTVERIGASAENSLANEEKEKPIELEVSVDRHRRERKRARKATGKARSKGGRGRGTCKGGDVIMAPSAAADPELSLGERTKDNRFGTTLAMDDAVEINSPTLHNLEKQLDTPLPTSESTVCGDPVNPTNSCSSDDSLAPMKLRKSCSAEKRYDSPHPRYNSNDDNAVDAEELTPVLERDIALTREQNKGHSQSVTLVTESDEGQILATVKPQHKKPLPGHCLTNVEPNRKQKLLFQSKRQAKSRDMKAAFFKGYKLAHEQTIEPIEFLFVIKDKKTDKYKYAGNGEMKERFENGLAITSTVSQDKKLYARDKCMLTANPDNRTPAVEALTPDKVTVPFTAGSESSQANGEKEESVGLVVSLHGDRRKLLRARQAIGKPRAKGARSMDETAAHLPSPVTDISLGEETQENGVNEMPRMDNSLEINACSLHNPERPPDVALPTSEKTVLTNPADTCCTDYSVSPRKRRKTYGQEQRYSNRLCTHPRYNSDDNITVNDEELTKVLPQDIALLPEQNNGRSQSVSSATGSDDDQIPAAAKSQHEEQEPRVILLPGHQLTNVSPSRKQKLLFQSKRQAKSRDMKAAFFKGYKLAHEQTLEPIEFLFVIKDKKTDKYKYAGNGEMTERFENGLAIATTAPKDKKLYTKDECMLMVCPDNPPPVEGLTRDKNPLPNSTDSESSKEKLAGLNVSFQRSRRKLQLLRAATGKPRARGGRRSGETMPQLSAPVTETQHKRATRASRTTASSDMSTEIRE